MVLFLLATKTTAIAAVGGDRPRLLPHRLKMARRLHFVPEMRFAISLFISMTTLVPIFAFAGVKCLLALEASEERSAKAQELAKESRLKALFRNYAFSEKTKTLIRQGLNLQPDPKDFEDQSKAYAKSIKAGLSYATRAGNARRRGYPTKHTKGEWIQGYVFAKNRAYDVNDFLDEKKRNVPQHGRGTTADYVATIESLDWALKNAPLRSGILFRGDVLNEKQFRKITKLNVRRKVWRYTSTSQNIGAANEFAEPQMMIEELMGTPDSGEDYDHRYETLKEELFNSKPFAVLTMLVLKEPIRALYLPPIHKIVDKEFNPGIEDEVILPRGITFKTIYLDVLEPDRWGTISAFRVVEVN